MANNQSDPKDALRDKIESENVSSYNSALTNMSNLLESRIKQLYTVVFGVLFFICVMEKNISFAAAAGIISAIIGLMLLVILALLSQCVIESNAPEGTDPFGPTGFFNRCVSGKLAEQCYGIVEVICFIFLIVPPIACIWAIRTFEPDPAVGFWCETFPKLVWCQ